MGEGLGRSIPKRINFGRFSKIRESFIRENLTFSSSGKFPAIR